MPDQTEMRHLLQGCPHEQADPVTWERHAEHIAFVLARRIYVALLVLAVAGIVLTW